MLNPEDQNEIFLFIGLTSLCVFLLSLITTSNEKLPDSENGYQEGGSLF